MDPDGGPRPRRGARRAVLVGQQLVRLCSPLVPGLETVAALTDTSEIKEEYRALMSQLVELRKACVELLCREKALCTDGSNSSGDCEAFLRSADEIAASIDRLQADIVSSESFRRQEYHDAVTHLSNQLNVVLTLVTSGRSAVASASISSDLSACTARVQEASDVLEQLVALFFHLDQALVEPMSRLTDKLGRIENEIREVKLLFWKASIVLFETRGCEVPLLG